MNEFLSHALRQLQLRSIDISSFLQPDLHPHPLRHLVAPGCLSTSLRSLLESLLFLPSNTMLSALDQMGGKLTLMEQELSSFSEKMLMSVATRYGKDSLQYMQAGVSSGSEQVKTNGNGTPVTSNL